MQALGNVQLEYRLYSKGLSEHRVSWISGELKIENLNETGSLTLRIQMYIKVLPFTKVTIFHRLELH